MKINEINEIFICSFHPYFLERENSQINEELEKIKNTKEITPFWEENVLILRKNQEIQISEVISKLDNLGYEKVYLVNQIGEFSLKGGTLNIFPVNSNIAISIEFFGNKIEKIFYLPIKIENEKLAKEILKKKLKSQKIFSNLKGIKIGDFISHLDHGIGIFLGKEKINEREYYILGYANDDKLYVPVNLERKLSRYIGFKNPKISRLGSIFWQKTKKKVKEDAEKLAKKLLEIYFKKETIKRTPYPEKDEIDSYLENTFPFEETPDQIKALEDIEEDLKSEKPLDRIICGDVGFGKTEIALRTMVRVVKSGVQTVMICPTTILANQHFQLFKERLKNLPIKVAFLTRLQSKREQKKIKKELKEGKIDILIGTHRILSKDIEFNNLGLLVIDDEQKFGVEQKEKLRKLKSSIDVLSLSATPIPRTLYMALSSIKNISLIQTPPLYRKSVKTFVLPFNKNIIKKAIEYELKRGGQVYYLHNLIETLKDAKSFLENLVPKTKIGIIYGRMKEKELIKTMNDFQNKKFDILIATTIIENGLDLPNVNTLIVADATKLGLSQAYQIRGRVGRSNIEAFAYFLFPKKLTLLAKKRLKALKEAKELGSGYKIALKDLEIRGAGNILGKEQSGNINKVGLNLYCQMIAQSIEKMRKDQFNMPSLYIKTPYH
ncbi:MAG: DEAD/DEAH box helicase [Minisyncoccia bacterium]